MKKILLISTLLAVVVLAFWYYNKKKKDGKTAGSVDSDNSPEQVASPPSGQTPVDPNTGAGKMAIDNQIKNIVQSNAYGQLRKGNKIGSDLFGVITNTKVRERIRQNALAGRVDDYSILLLPESYNPDFVNQLKELQNFTQNMTPAKVKSFGKDAFGKRLLKLSDFSQFDGGFNLFKKLGDVIDNPNGYGECTRSWKDVTNVGLIIPGNAKESCIISNMSKLSLELNRWATKMISENKRLEEAVFNMAIANLKAAGWVIIGF
jgi:hypothetical protein